MACSKCGRCCAFLFFSFPFMELTQDSIDYYNYHDVEIIQDKDKKTTTFKINKKCNNLTKDNLCKIFETRPQICREKITDDVSFMRIDGCTEI